MPIGRAAIRDASLILRDALPSAAFPGLASATSKRNCQWVAARVVLLMHSHSSDLGALYPRLTRAARKLAPDRAEDLVQDTLLAVLKRQSRGAEIDNLPAYCRRTLVNLAHSPPSPKGRAEPDQLAAPPRALLELKDVLAAVKSLPPAQRHLLCLCSSGATYAEIADATGLAPGTVMSRLSRARASLRQRLALPARHAVDALLAP